MVGRYPTRPWTQEEDALLINAVQLHGEQDRWKDVATLVPGRTNKACRKRWLHSLSPTVKKSPWTAAEDNQLLALYAIHGPKWSTIAREIPGRTDDACSKRYREALDPHLRKDEWTLEEDDKLLFLYREMGGKWGQVGQELRRSGLGCRNRYRHLVTKASKVASDPVSEDQLRASPKPSQATASDLSILREEANTPSRWPSPSLYYPPENLLPFVLSEDHSEQAATENLCFSEHVTVNHSPLLSALPDLGSGNHDSTSLSTIFENEQLSSTCNSPNLDTDILTLPGDLPLTFEQDGELSRIFSGVQFEDGIFYYQEDAHSPVSPESMHQGDPGVSIHFTAQEPSLHTPALPSDPNHLDNSSSTLSTPFHALLSLSPGTSPSPSTPIELPTSDFPTSTALHERRYSERPPKKASHKAIKPLGLARLSSILPLTTDPSVKPYACGRENCWADCATSSSACFSTSQELLDHCRANHYQDPPGEKPFRCALAGCGKSWKSLNGLQYHLQLSTAHFRTALSSSFTSQRSHYSPKRQPSSSRSETEVGDEAKRIHVCHHPQCFKAYRQASGLRYHLKHGHPFEMPAQLPVVPPALARQLPAKTRKMRRKN